MEINKMLDNESQAELADEGLVSQHKLPSDYLPKYLREAMKKAGVRRENGKFVKV